MSKAARKRVRKIKQRLEGYRLAWTEPPGAGGLSTLPISDFEWSGAVQVSSFRFEGRPVQDCLALEGLQGPGRRVEESLPLETLNGDSCNTVYE